mgnify:CR=1 FL=1
MNDIILELKGLDIEAKDIKTTSYYLNPIYDWTEKDGRILRGYQVNQNVTIKIRDLDIIGDAVAKSTEKGANQIGNISFTFDDEFELKNQAREAAIAKAKEKAESIADQTGIKLGKIVNVYENNYISGKGYYTSNAVLESSAYGIGGAGDESLISPTIETGQNEVQIEVSLVYEVK